jgi:hypothetical protein
LNTGNIGNVPLVLIAALCRDKSNPFGDSEKCSTDGTAYISFGQWVGFPHFSLDLWSFEYCYSSFKYVDYKATFLNI